MLPERDARVATIKALRPFVPAKDFKVSQRFYADLGFHMEPLGEGLAEMSLGAHSFLLQDFYVEGVAGNFVMHALVNHLDVWWAHIASLDLSSRYGVESPRAPKLEPWGLKVAYVFDPSGVCWHFAESSQNSGVRLRALVPLLQAKDIKITRDWYEGVLGFHCTSENEGWCQLARDDVALMFMYNDHLDAPQVTGTQYIYVDDVMSLWNAIAGRCTAEWGPETMPYGMLEFAIRDPNGYLISFGQHIGPLP